MYLVRHTGQCVKSDTRARQLPHRDDSRQVCRDLVRGSEIRVSTCEAQAVDTYFVLALPLFGWEEGRGGADTSPFTSGVPRILTIVACPQFFGLNLARIVFPGARKVILKPCVLGSLRWSLWSSPVMEVSSSKLPCEPLF